MSRGPTNVRSNLTARTSVLVLPAIFSMLGLVGVTAPSALRLAPARTEVESAQRQGKELRQLEARMASLRASNAPARARLVAERVDQLLPTELSAPEAYGVLRMIAKANGLELSLLSVGSDQDLDLVGPERRIIALPVQLGGTGSMSGVLDAIDDLRAHGYPTAVMGFRLDRPNTEEPTFKFLATLGLLHSVDNERWEASLGVWSQ